jgi:Nif-specific regulatory protein
MDAPRPSLTLLSGPQAGDRFELNCPCTTIGRDQQNTIVCSDEEVSKQHCSLSSESGQWILRDLGSTNMTFVNGAPIDEIKLNDGDRIRIGGKTTLLFQTTPGEQPLSTSGIELHDTGVGVTATMRPEESRYFRFDGPRKDRDNSNDLWILIRLATILQSARSIDALQAQLLEFLAEAFHADFAALILLPEKNDRFAMEYGLNVTSSSSAVPLSRTVIRQVIDHGVAICGDDIHEDPRLSGSKSLKRSNIQSLVCAPLNVFGRTIGALYLGSTTSPSRFSRENLDLFVGVAGISGIAVDNMLQREQLETENQTLRRQLPLRHEMIGDSPAMQTMLERIAKVAPSDLAVLIQGESGSGKELIARAIHENSPRASKPFVSENCAALTENLLESELFGYEAGAFTGAEKRRVGLIETAHQGTLFLDEIGDMSPRLQAALLRVLQEKRVRRVGGNLLIPVDFRLVCATKRDLRAMVKSGDFRDDLYFRIQGTVIVCPALRHRRLDLLLLANHFLHEECRRRGRTPMSLTTEARQRLLAYAWPGNVRELQNVMLEAVTLSDPESRYVDADDLRPEITESQSPQSGEAPTSLKELQRKATRQIITQGIAEAGGNISQAARGFSIHPNNLFRLMKRLGMDATPNA